MARKKKIEEEIVAPVAIKLPKAKYKIGEEVVVAFLGQARKATIIEVKQHPTHPRWIYKVKDFSGTVIPYVGINGAEKFANIIEPTKTNQNES